MRFTFLVALIFSFAAVLEAQEPRVTIRQTEPAFIRRVTKLVRALLSKDVTLDCFVEYNTQYQVEWRRKYMSSNGEKSEQISTGESVDDNIRFGMEKPTPNTYRLRIRSITESMEGVFECYVTTQHQTQKTDRVEVEVNQLPEIKQQATSTDVVTTEGTTISLSCDAIGIPNPRIEWSRQGNKLLPSPNNRERFIGTKLDITSASADDRGLYKCTASNTIGSVVTNIHVDVKFQPIVQAIETEQYQAVGYRMELQCLIEANPAPSDEELMWIRGAQSGNKRRTYSQSTGKYTVRIIRGAFDRLTYELVIDGVEDDDYDTYSCQAENTKGKQSATVRLLKSDTPQESVKLGAVVKGSSQGLWPYTYLILLSTLLAALLQQI